jgi:hypothetical protein
VCLKLEGAIEKYLCEHRDEIADKLIEILSDRITETIEQKKNVEGGRMREKSDDYRNGDAEW